MILANARDRISSGGRRQAISLSYSSYWHPQECGVQPQPPETEGLLEDADPFVDFPALNTESCNVCRLLSHFGHAISWLADITMRS